MQECHTSIANDQAIIPEMEQATYGKTAPWVAPWPVFLS